MSNKILTKSDIESVTNLIKKLYFEDQIPWVVGYSGGKDSTATLQLVWNAISSLTASQKKHKRIHVISTDTLVESPVVASWVNKSLDKMKQSAQEQSLPFEIHRLTPKTENTFWVNLIGKGYPAPRTSFRWCTSRLKIEPSNRFILDVIAKHGEAIIVLGTRKAESITRGKVMKHYENKRVRDNLSPNASLTNSLIFSPIENWSNDDVWLYLMQNKNPWSHSNKDLLSMYRGATADGECPLVVDTSTPSCGSSRFGCWVCTLVAEDKSMTAMITNDDEKAWMTPLLEFRNDIGNMELDRQRRDFRRMDGRLLLHNDRLVHGPYTKPWREYFLKRLLEIQKNITENGPDEFRDLELTTIEELEEIRRIWLIEKHEFDDSLPKIYKEIIGKPLPEKNMFINNGPFGEEEWHLLKVVCGDNPTLFELQTIMLDIEQRGLMMTARKGIIEELENNIRRCYYYNEEDAEKLIKAKSEITREVTTRLMQKTIYNGGDRA